MIAKILRSLTQAGIDVDEHTTAMIAYWDQDLICRYANTAYLDWFGVNPGDMIDKMNIRELLGSLYEKNEAHIQAALAGHVQVFRREIVSPFGQTRQSIATYWPVIEGEVKKGFYVHVEETALHNTPQHQLVSGINSKFIELSEPIAVVEKALHSCLLTGFPGITPLAKQHFISETRLKQSFKLRYGRSIFAHYRFLQMELADSYLKEKKASKKQLATLLNFTNSTNFLICYQKHLKERSDQKVIRELTKANDDRYKTFITQSPFALAMLDDKMNVKAASQKYVDDYHLNDLPLIGSNFYDLFPSLDPQWKKLHKAALKGKSQSGEDYVFERQNGSTICIKWDIRPWRNHDGKVGGIMIFTEDITAAKLKEEENSKILDVLNSAGDVIKIGIWQRNLRTGNSFWSKVTRAILEVPENSKVSSELALEYYKDEESRQRIEEATRQAIEKGRPFDIETEIVTGKGNRKLVRVVGYPEFKNGKCERLFGIFQELKIYA
ncbi:MAG TPA: PAS domain-containing protein [Pedobacter sp.]|uniref:PAS domain-containing protein n=1 Tax=Pedobacter sp. TaxID=1411316 RepID=UPI002B655620|nr:PAS domain-containing protein [Pedobacter sp.]HMI01430.1 PAS domain-containing protein [Pedobacter sp.]